MKAFVLKSFRDAYTSEIHMAGSEIEVTKKRLTEINSTKNGELVRSMKDIVKAAEGEMDETPEAETQEAE